MNYTDLYKLPEWQKTRLEIMEANGFRCSYCNTKDETLHVHHGYYEKGLKPWEYDERTLHCLCEYCHRLAHKYIQEVNRAIGELSLEELGMLYAGFQIGLIRRNNLKTMQRVFSKKQIKMFEKAVEIHKRMQDEG